MPKKPKRIKFQTTDQMQGDFHICINKGIQIYPIPLKNSFFMVEVNFKGKKSISKDDKGKEIEYSENEAWDMIFKYYKYYAGKN